MLKTRIILKGLDPKDSNHSAIQLCLRNLLDEAPSDASLKLSVLSGNKALLKIYSSQQQFYAETVNNENALEMVEALIGDVRGQLTEWKSQRFKVG